MDVDALNLREVMVFLVAAGVVVPLVRRLKISPVFGFLVVGLVIGPHGLARFSDALPWLSYAVITDLAGVRPLAELGVVFLLFMIGLELSLDRLWAMRRRVFGLGGAQVVVTGAVIAVIASFFDNTLAAAVVLGCAFAAPLAKATGSWVDLLVPWGAPEWALLLSSMCHVVAYAGHI